MRAAMAAASFDRANAMFFSFLCLLSALSLAPKPYARPCQRAHERGLSLEEKKKEACAASSRGVSLGRWREESEKRAQFFLYQMFYLELLRRQPVELRIHRGDDGRRRGLDAGARRGRQRGERQEAEEEGAGRHFFLFERTRFFFFIFTKFLSLQFCSATPPPFSPLVPPSLPPPRAHKHRGKLSSFLENEKVRRETPPR